MLWTFSLVQFTVPNRVYNSDKHPASVLRLEQLSMSKRSKRPSVTHCVPFISLSTAKHDGSVQFILTLGSIPVRPSGPPRGSFLLMPCVSPPLCEPGENYRPDTYETGLHTYACYWGRGVGLYGAEREIACWPDSGLKLFKYAWGPGVVALGHSSKCMIICMLSVITKRLACLLGCVSWHGGYL